MSKPKRGMSLKTLFRAVEILRNHHIWVDGPGFTFPSDDHLRDYLRDPVRYMRESYGQRACFQGSAPQDWSDYAPIEDDGNIITGKSQPDDRRELIYFIHDPCGGFVKIGVSADPNGRLKQLQTGCPNPLSIFLSFPGDRADETRLHALFEPLRAEGEWFKADPWLFRMARYLAESRGSYG